MEVKKESVEPKSNPKDTVTESGTGNIKYAEVKSSIDGNVEVDSMPYLSRFKSIATKLFNINEKPEENKEKEKVAVETPIEENAEQPLIGGSVRLSFEDRKLSNLPLVKKIEEPKSDPKDTVTESGTGNIKYAEVKSSIDGNVEVDSMPYLSRFKSIAIKLFNINEKPEENKEKEKVALETPIEENAEQPLMGGFVKLSLEDRKLSNLPLVKKIEEPKSDLKDTVTESGTGNIKYAEVKSSIAGNLEVDSIPDLLRFKSIATKLLNINEKPEENKEKEKVAVETPIEENAEQPLVAASIKPNLENRKLSNLPLVKKGEELSGLCFII